MLNLVICKSIWQFFNSSIIVNVPKYLLYVTKNIELKIEIGYRNASIL